jgi:hypothetical protein
MHISAGNSRDLSLYSWGCLNTKVSDDFSPRIGPSSDGSMLSVTLTSGREIRFIRELFV